MITRKNAWMWGVGALVVVLILFLVLRKLMARRASRMPVVEYSEPPSMYVTRMPTPTPVPDDDDDDDSDDEDEDDDDMGFATATPTATPTGMPMMWPVSS